MNQQRLACTFLASLLAASAAVADTIHVDASATGTEDGESWVDAFTDLQDALAVAVSGDEIWVAAGVYYAITPEDPGDVTLKERQVSFQLPDGVGLYGGFPEGGGGTQDRDWQAHITVLSGDIDGNDTTDEHGVVTDPDDIQGDNTSSVVRASGLDETAVLDGFHITGGLTAGGATDSGGGLFNNSGDPTLAHLSFRGNQASRGGGIFNQGGSPSLTNVSFQDNRGSITGGGMDNNGSQPTLTDVSFSNNQAGWGGGMSNAASAPILTDVSFIDNVANVSGGGMINEVSSNPILTDVHFIGNQAGDGGGMSNDSGSNPTLNNVDLSGNQATAGGGIHNNSNSDAVLINVRLSGNQADAGGGMNNQSSHPTLVNVSISGNQAEDGGGMYNDASNPALTNTIFWNNQDGTATNTPSASIHNLGGSDPVIAWSLVANCNPGGSWVSACGSDGSNNLADADPLFIDTPDPGDAPTVAGNLRLQPGSPVIDAGDPAIDPGVFPNGPADPVDADNQPRIVGHGIDPGLYELQPALTFDTAELDFGEVLIGKASPFQIATLQSAGAVAEAVSYSISTPFLTDTSDCGSSLPAAGSDCLIRVLFAPSEAGEVAGTLEIVYLGDVIAELELTGRGVTADYIFSDQFES